MVGMACQKLSLLGKWYAERIESNGMITEIPDSEDPKAFHFRAGGGGISAAGRDTC